MMTKNDKDKLRSTVALLNSMVNGGEQHSMQSKKEVTEALAIINNLHVRDISKQMFCPSCGDKNWDRKDVKKHCLTCGRLW